MNSTGDKMIVKVLCLKEEINSIQKLKKEDWELEPVLTLAEASNLSGAAIISHSVICETKAVDFSSLNEIYLYFAGLLVDISDTDSLLEQRQEAVNKKDYTRAKSINDILIDIDFIKKNTVSLSSPDYLQIETTSFCNAKCIMCSHYFSDNKGAKCLQNETVQNMEDAIELSHTISLNGMGEPFTSPNVSDQIDYYAKLGNKIVTNTNLSVLNDRLINQINDYFEWLEISVDGATATTYESIRKNLKLDIIKKHLARLKEECPNVRKHIATVIMRQNVKEMPQMVELAYEAGAQIITFMTLNANIIIRNSFDEMCNYPNALAYYSKLALKKGEELGIPVIVPNMNMLDREIDSQAVEEELAKMESIPMYKSDAEVEEMLHTASIVDEYLKDNDEIQRDTIPSNVKCHGICDWILKQSYIDLNGNVAMCCRNQSFFMGNVNDEGSFGTVWNGPFYQKMREIFYSGYVPEACLKCGLIESGNLKHLSIEMSEDFYKDPAYKLKQKETLKKILTS